MYAETDTEEYVDAEDFDGIDFAPPMQSTALAVQAAQVPAKLTPQDYKELAAAALTSGDVIQHREMVKEFIKAVAVPGVDYGQIPGTKGNTMLKPLYEKCVQMMGISIRAHMVGERREVDFVEYRYTAEAWKNGALLGSVERIANSDEPCFKVWVVATPPEDKDAEAQMIAYKTAKYDGNRFLRHLPHPNPREIALKIAARASKRAAVEVLRNVTGMTDILSGFPIAELGYGAPANRRPMQQGTQQRTAQPQQIREADSTAFWLAVNETNRPKEEFSALAAQAQQGKISWAEAIAKLPKK